MGSRKDVVIISSGGLDSTTLMYRAAAEGHRIISVSFDYGQRHVKELSFAENTARKLGADWCLVPMAFLGGTFAMAGSESTLVTDNDVPEGHYAADNMKKTVVPNRNMIMLAIAGGIAVSAEGDELWTGVHSGDHFIYPDCRPEFIQTLDDALIYGNEGFGKVTRDMLRPYQDPTTGFLKAPFLYYTKEDIAAEAFRLKVPLNETWSCYKGGEKHCGRCGTCVERIEAIQGAIWRYESRITGPKVTDPTEYEDPNYWQTVVRNR